ncbi:hypothetical protein PBY51_019758 [Eleginops maclovinus]|uniref:RRM domain-containing protein n=1 Tax=Eleginops maclovinus TaxID=56733 RepID=A0AAN7XQK5_ELEMC|nr:hypothetical protein PBY51_019758 [Eleginops maclovinus]
MKKKLQKSEEEQPGQQPADYVVGQVSGSLFPKKSAASGSLSALFGAAAPAPPVLFQPAPKPVLKTVEETEKPKETPEVEVPLSKKKQKQLKNKTKADLKVENRELSLQCADDDEQGPAKKKIKKGAESSGENDAEKWVIKRQNVRARKEEEVTKKKRTVFVGNLPVSCTRKTLQSLFREKGSIESVRFRSVVREDPAMSRKVAAIQRKVHPKKQSMNAYVVFKDEEGVTKALERNGMEIEKGFHIRVDKVTDSSSHDHKRSVFVGNLPFEINELSFRQHFEECGPVEAVRLVRDQNSGLGKGFGYVLFESADSVQLALELDGSKLDSRTIRVKRSVKKEKQKSKPDGKGAPGRAGKGPVKGSGPDRGGARGGFKAEKKFSGNRPTATKSSTSFKGEMTDPNKKSKKTGLKKSRKPRKPRKTVHI